MRVFGKKMEIIIVFILTVSFFSLLNAPLVCGKTLMNIHKKNGNTLRKKVTSLEHKLTKSVTTFFNEIKNLTVLKKFKLSGNSTGLPSNIQGFKISNRLYEIFNTMSTKSFFEISDLFLLVAGICFLFSVLSFFTGVWPFSLMFGILAFGFYRMSKEPNEISSQDQSISLVEWNNHSSFLKKFDILLNERGGK